MFPRAYCTQRLQATALLEVHKNVTFLQQICSMIHCCWNAKLIANVQWSIDTVRGLNFK